MNNQTFTLTFGECAENHKGMEIIGNPTDRGFDMNDLQICKENFESLGYMCELIDLNNMEDFEKAYVLIIKNGVEALGVSANDLFEEHNKLEKDTKAYMYGRVVNKHARHNLCFSDYDRSADYENGKGTIVSFERVPLTKIIRNKFPLLAGGDNSEVVEKFKNMQCEGNYYYNINKCGIGFHGDSERKKVFAVRMGERLPLHYQWFYQGKPIGNRIILNISHGDIYIMSEKAVGNDWKKKNIKTLRHATGCEKYTKI